MPKFTAVILAAGSGSRMHSDTPKQYMELSGKPLICHTIEAFERSAVDEIVLVVTPGDVEYVLDEIVEKYHYDKVVSIVEGGSERSESVLNGTVEAEGDYVLIHDGARAFITEEIIARMMDAVVKYKACIAAVPEKNTIKVAEPAEDVEMKEDASTSADIGSVKDESTAPVVAGTLDRSMLWEIQTPQAFDRQLLLDSYAAVLEGEPDMASITDDAMVVESGNPGMRIRLVMGDYMNIKVTTPEDMIFGEAILASREKM